MKIKIPSLSMRGRPRKKVGAISYLESSYLTAHAGRPLVKWNEDAKYEGEVGEETCLPSHSFPSLPSPFFAPATQGRKSPLDSFLTGTTAVLIITYRGGYMLVTCDVLLAKKPGTKPQTIPNFKGGFRSGPRGRGAEATLFL